MASRVGLARRIEAAHARQDAALAVIAPDTDRPFFGRNRGTAELLRAEWLADTLEGIASGTSGSPQSDESTTAGGKTQGDDSDAPQTRTRRRKTSSESD